MTPRLRFHRFSREPDGYRTTGASEDLSPRVRSHLERFSFGQTANREYLQSLLRHPAFLLDHVDGYAVLTRVFHGSPDPAGRATLQMESILVERSEQPWIVDRLRALLGDSSLWDLPGALGAIRNLPADPSTTLERGEFPSVLEDVSSNGPRTVFAAGSVSLSQLISYLRSLPEVPTLAYRPLSDDVECQWVFLDRLTRRDASPSQPRKGRPAAAGQGHSIPPSIDPPPFPPGGSGMLAATHGFGMRSEISDHLPRVLSFFAALFFVAVPLLAYAELRLIPELRAQTLAIARRLDDASRSAIIAHEEVAAAFSDTQAVLVSLYTKSQSALDQRITDESKCSREASERDRDQCIAATEQAVALVSRSSETLMSLVAAVDGVAQRVERLSQVTTTSTIPTNTDPTKEASAEGPPGVAEPGGSSAPATDVPHPSGADMGGEGAPATTEKPKSHPSSRRSKQPSPAEKKQSPPASEKSS